MRKLTIVLMICLLLSVPALAVDTDGLEEALPGPARDVLGEVTVADVLAGEDIFSQIWERMQAQVRALLAGAARSAGTALTVTLLCSAAGALSPEGKTPWYVLMGGALAVMGACAGDIRSFLDQTGAAMDSLEDFSRALLPCVAAASAAAGQAAAGAARYTVSALFMDILMTLGRNGVMPMIYAYGAVSAANAALPEGALDGPVKLLRWACGPALAALTTVFTVCLSLSGVISGGADKLAGSAAKTVISAALPVVGKIVADGAETYLAGAKLLRGAVGLFGLAAVLCVCLGPMVGLGLHYILFKAAACVSAPFSDGRLSGLLENIASCYGMALGLLGSMGVMLFISAVLGSEAAGL
jgi:stage III sporulation protein AE